MSRISKITRKTTETEISISLNLDGAGKSKIDTGIGFLDHMLELFAKHGLFDLTIKASGDLQVDEHHTVEDMGIVLGEAFRNAIGEKLGIKRYGFFVLPMDETLTTVAFDFGGRYSFRQEAIFTRERVGDLSTELVYDFWDAFAQNAKANLIIKSEFGRNNHHMVEGIFKCVARSIRTACEIDERAKEDIASTKGVI